MTDPVQRSFVESRFGSEPGRVGNSASGERTETPPSLGENLVSQELLTPVSLDWGEGEMAALTFFPDSSLWPNPFIINALVSRLLLSSST